MSKLTAIVPNPLAAIAARWTPSPRTVRLAALSALLMSIVIIVTGGAVRLTGSGLGCDTWPKCSGDSLIATREMGLHGAIEFGNRMLTYVLTAAVGWTIIAARAAKPRRRSLSRLGWLQFFVVLFNAVLGGITVLLELNPYIVAGHFLAATALLTVTAVTWQRTQEGDGAPRPLAGPRVRGLAWALAAVTAVLVIVGTVVTGAGPHAGDSSEVPRMGVDWETVTRVHALLAWAVVLLTAALWLVLRAVDAPAAPRKRTALLMAVLLAQGAIGYAQYLTELPEVLVGLHMLGSCLVWVGVIRVLLSLRERPAVPAEPPVPPAPRQEGPAVAAAL
ncbi:heme A synthase [Streptomyces albus]|uniref:COX15/CtaA family protein n=1 Tax=Streptomyces albus TaxID=1888 RepID=UPI00068DC931|nr:COX15/CtaA family protein [Streptomyces albus]